MATIGQALTTPEAGWKRYEETSASFKYFGSSWVTSTSANYSGGASKYTTTASLHSVSFKFTGPKLRIVSYRGTDRNPAINLVIDGVSYTYSAQGVAGSMILLFDKTDLTNGTHTVVVSANDASATKIFEWDAIDIDSTGRLYHPDEVTDPKDLVVGKRIRCHYSASSNVVGAFSGLGQETSDFIPVASSATPNGDFYYIMCEDFNKNKILVADRNVQSNISWDVLNSAGIASGSGIQNILNAIPNITSDTSSLGIVTSDSLYANTSWARWKAFDGNGAVANHYGWCGAVINSGWLAYDFIVPKIINSYSLLPSQASPSVNNGCMPKNWTFEGWNGSQWIVLHQVTNEPSWGTAAVTTTRVYNFNNTTPYSKYRINISATISGTYEPVIGQMGMFENTNYSNTTRLLTGGITSTDKDNEWDKYIVNSTLGGTITAGDNNVWSWSGIYSWASTTTAAGGYRVIRGSGLANSYSNLATSSTAGFRPVLIIESNPQTRFLIKDQNEYKTFETSWNTISTTLPSKDTFISDGITDLAILNRKATIIHQVMSNNGTLGNGKTFKTTIDLNKYFEIQKLNMK
ncbi:hypothetical protein SAMN04487895_101776 [Paenibacillus sophorae]|uniref:F5/8 type C domain-containing protein n=1 Tax=Paenibacillus sophorae TaxID=1333845 RepID=A0A1H8H7M8_9BACL|nr:hypothetical protein [Paenibacillus sophorae]QWU14466.1 hypothetical protein KP014_21395 [Paenibacillus sophorae]SEN52014.1 hypothetical protein SAMN04487895_101776 [Paenibacillus sophorae]